MTLNKFEILKELDEKLKELLIKVEQYRAELDEYRKILDRDYVVLNKELKLLAREIINVRGIIEGLLDRAKAESLKNEITKFIEASKKELEDIKKRLKELLG